MILLITLLIAVNACAADLYIDQFHGLQNRLVLSVEQPIDSQESLSGGVNVLQVNTGGVRLDMKLWEVVYRRYVGASTQSGAFYSFGVRTGRVDITQDGFNNETELAVMPFYDIGLKSKLSKRWHHALKIEAGYLILYTKSINIHPILGLQFTPFFSFGYNLD
jgi:hypothetical protein